MQVLLNAAEFARLLKDDERESQPMPGAEWLLARNGMAALVAMLASNDADAAKQSAWPMKNLVHVRSHVSAMLAAGVVPALLAALQNAPSDGYVRALSTLATLSQRGTNAVCTIVAAGGLEVAVRLSRHPNRQRRMGAIALLAMLAQSGSFEVHERISRSEALSMLLAPLLTVEEDITVPWATEGVADVLSKAEVVVDDDRLAVTIRRPMEANLRLEAHCRRIAESGVVPALVHVLGQAATYGTSGSHASRALTALGSWPSSVREVMCSGTLPPLALKLQQPPASWCHP